MLNGGLFYFSLSLFLPGAQTVKPAEIPIALAGNLFFSSSYLTRGTYYCRDERDIEVLIDRILDQYADAGFPFCRVRPRYAGPPDTSGTLRLAVEEGPRIRIADYLLRIRGKTDSRSLRKWLRAGTGQFFSRRELERIKTRLADSGLFREFPDRIVRRDDEYYLQFDLVEDPSDYLSAGGSLAQSDAFFFGELDSRNLLGTLRSLNAQYEYRKLFRIAYADPILLAPVEVELNLRLVTSDSCRLVGLSGRLAAPVGNAFRIAILSGREIVTYTDPDLPGYQSNLVGLGLNFRPRLGPIRTEHDGGVEYLFRADGRLRVKYDGGIEVMHISLQPHYWWTRTGQFEYFDYFRVGGAKTIRGYLEEEIAARSVFWLNAVYNRYSLFPLFDLAYAEGTIYYAYGLGLAAQTALGQASLALAWPKDGDWLDGKIHIILEKSF
jgi:outer membrane protein assembly factor BamA